jgi:small-conductance mechanosensitive channel
MLNDIVNTLKTMDFYEFKIIESILILAFYFVTKKVSFKLVDKFLSNQSLLNSRGNLVKRVLKIVYLTITLVLISIIWGVNQSEFAVFVGSALTVIGVALFAQWSLLSNITSSIILFFNHPIRIGDTITILEAKDYTIEGTVSYTGIFFITLTTSDGSEILIPNNQFIQKSIIKKKQHPNLTTKE